MRSNPLFPTAVSAVESRKRWLLSGMADSGGVLVIVRMLDPSRITALLGRWLRRCG